MELTSSKNFYDNEAVRYDEKRWLTSAGRFVHDTQINIFKYLASEIKGHKVLEIGAGTGRFTSILLEQGNMVTALDISKHMLDQLVGKLKNQPNFSKLSVLVSDAREMLIESSSFDCIVCINAISHIPEYARVMREIARVLRPGGVLIINFPNYLSLYFPFGMYVNFKQKSIMRDVFTKWYNIYEVSKVVVGNGFNIEKIIGQFHVPTSTPNLIIPIARFINNNIHCYKLSKLAPIIFLKAIKPE